MLARAASATLCGVDAIEVQVEADIANGLPNVLIVGLPGTAVQESRERVRAALQNSELAFPMRRVVINLAPADTRKEGPAFDLPIAVALLAAQGAVPPTALERTLFVGELALDGTLRPVRGGVSIGLLAAAAGYRRAVVPPGNAAELALAEGLEVFAPIDLRGVVGFLRGSTRLAPNPPPGPAPAHPGGPDLADVKGHAAAKRALEVAAAGGHNLLLSGPPGSGKTMLASRLPGLMPDLERDEAVDVTRIHSAAGLQVRGLLRRPPFRRPHHTVSYAGLVGGGALPRPGEVSLAHHGVLFLDEFGEFSRRALETLRQPLEEGIVTVSRVRGSVSFPASFLLVAGMNPCPCGFLGDSARECVCSAGLVQRYRDRLSGPLLDRVDLRITVSRLPVEDLLRAPKGEPSAVVRERVGSARSRALARQGVRNGLLTGRALREHARLGPGAEAFARGAIRRLGLSARGFDRLLRIARTVADLEGKETLAEAHLAEAVAYRGADDFAARPKSL